MSVSWSEWPYMVSPANTQVWYIFRNHFSTRIQWWCQLHDQSDHIWQVRQTHKCGTFSWTIFQCEFNGDVSFMIRVTIYGKSGKHTSMINFQEPFFWREFNGDVGLVMRLSIYGKSSKHTSVIHLQERIFNLNYINDDVSFMIQVTICIWLQCQDQDPR